jgi:hypothetical protein
MEITVKAVQGFLDVFVVHAMCTSQDRQEQR